MTALAALWSWLAGSRVGRLVAAVGAALIAFLTLRAYWLRQGAKDERESAERADHERAGEIRNRVDAVRTADSVHNVDDSIYRD